MFSTEAQAVYTFLQIKSVSSKQERMILVAIDTKVRSIKNNIHYGDPIAKKLIPQEYVTHYRITNLFRIELPQFRRLLYTLIEGESTNEIVAFVLDIIDHTTYDKKCGYRSK